MFRTIFSKSLRDYRWAMLGWGIGLGVVVYSQYATYSSTFTGSSPAQIQQLVQQFRFFGEAIRVDTPGGFTTYKIMGLLPLLLGIWTVLAGARMARGEEERGSLDILLSTPQSRARVLGQKALALAAATVVIALLIGLWILAGMASAKVTVDPAGALLAAFDVALAALVFGMLALLLAQFMSRGAAAGWAGGLLALSYVLDGTGRATNGAEGIRRISPLYYYDLSTPLVPGYGANWGALAVLLVLCLIGVGLALPLFLRRDVGRPALADVTWGRRAAAPAQPHMRQQVIAAAKRDPWVRGIGVQAVRRQGTATLWWAAALAVFSGYLVIVAKTAEKQLQDLMGSSPFIKQLFSGANLGTNNGFLSALVFFYIPLIVTIFAGLMAYRWATDLDAGRLEMVLGAPVSRWRVLLERYAAVVGASVVVLLGIWLGIVLFAQASGFSIDVGRVAVASVGMLPLELVTASLVYALAGLLPPGAVVGIMSAFVGVSFLAEGLKTLLKLPDWALNLSIFHQYGTPILDGLNWGAFAVMLLIAAALLALGGVQFRARDLDRGAVES